MDNTHRLVEDPNEPDFANDVAQGAYVDEVPEQAPPEDWDAEDLNDVDDADEIEPVDTEFDDET